MIRNSRFYSLQYFNYIYFSIKYAHFAAKQRKKEKFRNIKLNYSYQKFVKCKKKTNFLSGSKKQQFIYIYVLNSTDQSIFFKSINVKCCS